MKNPIFLSHSDLLKLSGNLIEKGASVNAKADYDSTPLHVTAFRGDRDAVEFLIAGASAVQVGTASFVNPRATLDIVEGVRRFCVERGIHHIGELIGSLKTEKSS